VKAYCWHCCFEWTMYTPSCCVWRLISFFFFGFGDVFFVMSEVWVWRTEACGYETRGCSGLLDLT
jgi:hypothetical protein